MQINTSRVATVEKITRAESEYKTVGMMIVSRDTILRSRLFPESSPHHAGVHAFNKARKSSDMTGFGGDWAAVLALPLFEELDEALRRLRRSVEPSPLSWSIALSWSRSSTRPRKDRKRTSA